MRFLGTLLLLLMASVSAHADPLRDAQAAYDRGLYARALEIWRPLAEQGNAEAQVGLANLYLGGYGATRDEAEAMAWFRKAADQGNASGQFSLGSLYYGRKDYGSAAPWYRRAAEQGHAIAQVRLGRMYAEGLGVGRDDAQAYKWFAVAATRSSDNYARSNALQGRDSVAGRLTPNQRALGQKLAVDWTPKRERQ